MYSMYLTTTTLTVIILKSYEIISYFIYIFQINYLFNLNLYTFTKTVPIGTLIHNKIPYFIL